MSPVLTAGAVVAALESHASAVELEKVRARLPADVPAIGVRMRSVFDVAKAATALPRDEWDRLVAEPAYEARMAAFSILDFWSRRDLGSLELCDLYLQNHDRIATWDMVDRAAPRVVGAALANGPYGVLHELAASSDPLRRRTAITAPLWFARYGEPDDVTAGFEIAALLCTDPDPAVHKPVGIYLAYAGERSPEEFATFLDQHGPSMPAAARSIALRKQ